MLGGEIASAFVRIRPDFSRFRSETQTQIRSALRGVNEEVSASARANVAATEKEIAVNRELALSYAQIGSAAAKGSEEAAVAASLGAKATARAEALIGAEAVVAEAQVAGLRTTMLGLGGILGIAFGVEELVKFAKEAASGAASVQKSTEVIKTGFGEAAEAVLKFGESGAAKLGISAKTADATSARFAILFKNIGIGKETAATMAVNLEKLAGSLSAIRGVDPSRALQQITLAMLGNVRSLKQLGLAVDPATEKIAAFKLGLISSQTAALTPAIRAQAIYALATAHLGDFLKQAKESSGDFANSSRSLSAVLSNIGDTIGKAMIPPLARTAGFLSDVLPASVSKTGRAFKDFGATVKAIATPIANALHPFIQEIGRVKDALKLGGVHAGIQKLKDDLTGLSPAGKVAAAAAVGVSVALVAVAASAFPITATIAAIFGLGVALKEAYDHSARFREIVKSVQSFIDEKVGPAFRRLATAVEPSLAQIAVSAQRAFGSIAKFVQDAARVAQAIWARFGDTIRKITSVFLDGTLHVINNDFKIIGSLFDVLADVLEGKWGDAWGSLKTVMATFLDNILTAVKTWGGVLVGLFDGIWKNVEIIFLEGVKKALAPIAAIQTSFHLPGVGGVGFKNPAKSAQDAIQGLIDDVKTGRQAKAIADAAATNAAKALDARTNDPKLISAATNVGKTIVKHVKVGAAGAADAVTGATAAAVDTGVAEARSSLAALRQKLHDTIAQNARDLTDSVNQAKANLIQIGSTLADQIGQILDKPFQVAATKIQDTQDRLAVLFDTRAALLDATARKIQIAQDKLAIVFDAKGAKLDAEQRRISRLQAGLGLRADRRALEELRGSAVLPGGKQLSTDTETALAQLTELAKKNKAARGAILDFRDKYQAAVLTVSSDVVSKKQAALAEVRTAKEKPLGQKAAQVGLAQSVLADTRANATSPLNLEGERNKVAQDAVAHRKDAITREIGDLTTALASGQIKARTFNRRIAALLADDRLSYAKAGELLGTAFRHGYESQVSGLLKQAQAISVGPRRPGTGQEPHVVQPLLTLEHQTRTVANLTRQIGNHQVALQKKIAANTAKAAKAAQKTADAAHAAASVTLGATAKSIAKNPGKQSHVAAALNGG